MFFVFLAQDGLSSSCMFLIHILSWLITLSSPQCWAFFKKYLSLFEKQSQKLGAKRNQLTWPSFTCFAPCPLPAAQILTFCLILGTHQRLSWSLWDKTVNVLEQKCSLNIGSPNPNRIVNHSNHSYYMLQLLDLIVMIFVHVIGLFLIFERQYLILR